jgi:hypothetical protein
MTPPSPTSKPTTSLTDKRTSRRLAVPSAAAKFEVSSSDIAMRN